MDFIEANMNIIYPIGWFITFIAGAVIFAKDPENDRSERHLNAFFLLFLLPLAWPLPLFVVVGALVSKAFMSLVDSISGKKSSYNDW